ncbi:MAG: bile acid:sodium symporter [Burkholderiales bacterium]
MPVDGPVPGWLFSIVAAATLFVVMFDLGLAIPPRELWRAAKRPVLLAQAAFAAVVAVPAIAWLLCRALDLPRSAEIGIMLMAIAPGAPVALRRSLGAGGHRVFAPALQMLVVALAIVSMPLAVAAFDEYYGSVADIDPRELARQVFFAQFLPLALGMTFVRLFPAQARRFEKELHEAAGWLLAGLVVLALANIWRPVADVHWRALLAIVAITALSLWTGHLMGGGERATRTATAISCGMRNTGLALLVAALNRAPEGVVAAILAYFVIGAITVVPYIIWRKGRSPAPSPGEAHGKG